MDAFTNQFQTRDNKHLIAAAILRGAALKSNQTPAEVLSQLVVGLVEGDDKSRKQAIEFFKVGINVVMQDAESDNDALLFVDMGLNKVIRAASLQPQMRKIFMLWPSLKIITERFADYITPILGASSSGTMLEESLINAVGAYKAETVESRRAQAYLIGLAALADRLTCVSIKGKYSRGFVTWQPFSQPITEWMHRYKLKTIKTEIKACSCDGETAKAMLLSRILTMEDINMAGFKFSVGEGRQNG